MKKLLATLVVLSFVGGNLFALDLGNGLEITGAVKVGLRVGTEHVATEDEYQTRAWAYNHDSDRDLDISLAARYTTDLGGLAIRLRADTLQSVQTGARFDYYYGWLNFLNSMITVYGGAIDGDLWGTVTARIMDTGSDALSGIRVVVKPFDGFSIGFAIPFPMANAFTDPGNPSGGIRGGPSIGNIFKDTVFGAAYEVPDVFIAHLTVDLVTDEFQSSGQSGVAILFSTQVSAISPLVIDLDFLFNSQAFQVNNGEAMGGAGDHYLCLGYQGVDAGVRVTFAADPLTVWGLLRVRAGEMDSKLSLGDAVVGKAADDKVDDNGFGFGATLHAAYTLSPAFIPFLRLGTENFLKFDENGLFVRIGFDVPLAENLTFEVYDQISGIGLKADDSITNAVQLDFNWSF